MSVLVTNASNAKGLVVTQSLGKKGIEVTTTDYERFSCSFFSRYSKHHFLSAPAEKKPDEFINTIINYIKRKEIDVLMPVNSIETLLISKYKNKLTPYTKVPFEDFPKMMQLNDKNEVMKIADELNIRTPRTYCFGKIDDLERLSKTLDYPAVIKLRDATSSKGISYANSAHELISKCKQTIKNYNLDLSNYPIVQEYIPGNGYGVSMLYNHGNLRAIFTHKRLREYPITGGPSTLRISVSHPEMERAAMQLLEYVDWHGVAMVEFKVDERTNKPVLLEVNPRFWGSIYLAIVAGVDFPYLLYKMAKEGDVESVSNYALGVKARFLFNDYRSLISHFRASDHRSRIIKEFIKFSNKETYYDGLLIEDILPAIIFAFEGAKNYLTSNLDGN
jgi:predicted ATP-grasp superfamily ATP-dependent carboligase